MLSVILGIRQFWLFVPQRGRVARGLTMHKRNSHAKGAHGPLNPRAFLFPTKSSRAAACVFRRPAEGRIWVYSFALGEKGEILSKTRLLGNLKSRPSGEPADGRQARPPGISFSTLYCPEYLCSFHGSP